MKKYKMTNTEKVMSVVPFVPPEDRGDIEAFSAKVVEMCEKLYAEKFDRETVRKFCEQKYRMHNLLNN
jgi:hypothetical protein